MHAEFGVLNEAYLNIVRARDYPQQTRIAAPEVILSYSTAGKVFLNWLTPSLGLRWIDVGCGNGAFTELRRI